VDDVHAFPGHIACDSRSASEIVVPVFDASGTLIAVFGYLADPSVLAVLPPKVAAVVTGLGIILAAFGARAAVAKNGTGS
jgi:hypothetical protein